MARRKGKARVTDTESEHADESRLPSAMIDNRVRTALRMIKIAWGAALVSVAITIVFVLLALAGRRVAGVDASSLVDVTIMLILTYGVYRKSRTCAVLLLTFFTLDKVVMWVRAGSVRGLPLVLVFLWFFAQGVIGTFRYHRLLAQRAT